MRGPYKDSEDRFDDLQILGEAIGRETPINKVQHKSMVDGRRVNTAEEEVSAVSRTLLDVDIHDLFHLPA